MKTAVITGITGQDGAYLARFLLKKDYQVYGTCRRTSSVNLWRLQELCLTDHPQLHIVDYDLTDLSSAIRLLETTQPGEVYNLAAQSFVGLSFDQPVATTKINCLGSLNILEAIRMVNPKIRFYQASSSEMFGKVQSVPQNEETPFYPRSPYGVSKLFGHWMTINYRESYNMFGASGILFNHESPLRGREFVTRKITDGLARVKLGEQTHIELGNLDAKRDWGFAGDYVEGMHAMLQLDDPDTFVLATGRTERVRDFVEMTCKALDIDIAWEGAGKEEKGLDTKTGATIVKINPHFYRPAEVDLLIGDAEKAKAKLGWRATTPLEELCAMMVESDLRRVKNGNSF
ncbi:GDP-mannose 4,6-dehydratase [Nitrospina watsonii]|uniref:GDP-mannose 4,6-dehydratase n=1 Tax=Nitrospina watsonii TaxID=1323948 RepID=A0ABM9HAA2_9BACT|nr:GDP-mannose 4,6-dehydratase [Nitrospina watsonii]CAI2717072.1 GDP-mannose 4,6-dehydratase [Nitrospina watsonii]